MARGRKSSRKCSRSLCPIPAEGAEASSSSGHSSPATVPVPPPDHELPRIWATGGLLMQGADHRSQPLGLQDGLCISLNKPPSASSAVPGTAVVEEGPAAPAPLSAANAQVHNEHCLVAVVCDGTSTIDLEHGPTVYSRNQIGASIASTLISRRLVTFMSDRCMLDLPFETRVKRALTRVEQTLKRAFIDLLNMFGLRSNDCTSEYKAFVGLHFFFTVQGLVVTEGQYCIFGLGDGYYGINKEVIEFDDPEVWGERLLRATTVPRALVIKRMGSLDGVETLWVATDGIVPALMPESRERFSTFLNHQLSCGRNSEGEDTTIRAFRLQFSRHCRFGDDVALAIIRHREPMSQVALGDHWRYGLPVANS